MSKPDALLPDLRIPIRATGRAGLRMNTPKCSKKCTYTLTCQNRLTASSWFTTGWVRVGNRTQVNYPLTQKGADAGRDSNCRGRVKQDRRDISGDSCWPTDNRHPRRALPLGHLWALVSRRNQELHGPASARRAERSASAR